MSRTKVELLDDDRKIREDRSSEFRSKLDHLLKPDGIKWQDYGIFFACAGHAGLIDYPDAKGLQGITANMYDAGDIISTVCHGGAIFPVITDSKTGKSIIAGKKVTGLTTNGEDE
jgi:putative intracellular protease/amidase